MKHILKSAKAPNTVQVYTKVYSDLSEFLGIYGFTFPLSVNNMAIYLAYLFSKGSSSATITTYSSAVGYFHKVNNQLDPTSSFLVRETLGGIRKLRPSMDVRAPITFSLLSRLLKALTCLSLGNFDTAAFQSMFTLAFFGLLRIGEIVATLRGEAHILTRGSIKFAQGNKSLTISFVSFKHSKPNTTHVITVYPQPLEVCPIYYLLKYLSLAQCSNSNHLDERPLFSNVRGAPYYRDKFCSILRSALSLSGVPDGAKIRSHSFRIGGASYAAKSGMSDSQIRYLGRWSSNAFLKYIRAL